MSPLTSDSPADDTNGATDGNAATNAGAGEEQAGCFRFSLRGMPQIRLLLIFAPSSLD